MELINVDELIEQILEKGQNTTRYEWGERWQLYWGEIEDAISKTPRVDAVPPSEAIPLDFIEKWLDEFMGVKEGDDITDLDMFKKDVLYGIYLLKADWRKNGLNRP